MHSYKTEIIKEIFDLVRYLNSNQLNSELTMIQLRTMMYISDYGKVKPTKIAQNFNITPASVTSQIDTLVQKNLLERIYNQNDKRVIEITLTKKGQELLEKELDHLDVVCKKTFGILTDQEQQKLLELVEKVNNGRI